MGHSRKHREKKENYVLALEEEIQRLRRTVHTSQLHIRVLADALSSHGVSIPDSPAPLQPEFNLAHVTLCGSPGPNYSLKLQKPDPKGYSPPTPAANGVHNSNVAMQSSDRNVLTDIDISPQYCHVDYTSPGVAVSSPVVSSSGDSAADYSGLEFVLAYAISIAFDDLTLTKPLQFGASMSPSYRPPFHFRWNARACPHP
jgi:hypothetical protein